MARGRKKKEGEIEDESHPLSISEDSVEPKSDEIASEEIKPVEEVIEAPKAELPKPQVPGKLSKFLK